MAPAWATTMSRFDGSGMIARSPVTPARIAASVPWPPSSSDGTSATISSPGSSSEPAARAEGPDRPEDRGDAGLHVAGAAAVQPAITDVATPRIHGPGRRIARRHDVEMARQDDPPTLAVAGPADHDRQRRTSHLLARPRVVTADGQRVRLDDLDGQAELPERVGRPGRDSLLRPGHRRDPDERLQVGDQPALVDRRRAGRGLSHAGWAGSCRSGHRSR